MERLFGNRGPQTKGQDAGDGDFERTIAERVALRFNDIEQPDKEKLAEELASKPDSSDGSQASNVRNQQSPGVIDVRFSRAQSTTFRLVMVIFRLDYAPVG